MNCKLLIEKNIKKIKKVPKYSRNGVYNFDFTRFTAIGGLEISKILSEIGNVIKTYGKSCKVINITLGDFKFKDKLTYIIFECIVYSLMIDYRLVVNLYYIRLKYELSTCGLSSSLFRYMHDCSYSSKEYEKKFYKMFDRNHFRKIYKSDIPEDSLELCILMSEIKSFLKYFSLNKLSINDIAGVVTELIDNAREHSLSDCLIDIDVSDVLIKEDDVNKYHCVNIAVVNFSDICIGDKIRKKFENKNYDDSHRYNMVQWAYRNHLDYFNDRYCLDDFYNIVAFQDSISGRSYETDSGGTGLTGLIEILEQNAEDHYCYMLSGDKGIDFNLNYLGYNDEKWIGFNKTKDFINDVPAL